MRRAHLLATLALTIASIGCDAAVEPTAPELAPQFAKSPNAVVHSVTAGGQVDYTDVFGSGHEVYGFTASVDGDGNVKGSFQSHWVSDGGTLRFAMDITCLSVNGNQAWLGGVITRSNDDYLPVGFEFRWRVVDNGEGKNAAPDQLSYFLYGGPDTAAGCAGGSANNVLFDWTEGNVQVR